MRRAGRRSELPTTTVPTPNSSAAVGSGTAGGVVGLKPVEMIWPLHSESVAVLHHWPPKCQSLVGSSVPPVILNSHVYVPFGRTSKIEFFAKMQILSVLS